MLNQAFPYRVGVHVMKFFFFLGVTPDIEIIKAALPETPVLRQPVVEGQQKLPLRSPALSAAHGPRDALFQNLQNSGHRAFGRFAEKQMHVIGHEHIAHQRELILAADLAQYFEEEIFGVSSPEQCRGVVSYVLIVSSL